MFCPKCRAEFVEGVSTCAHCEVALVDEIPADDIFASPDTMAAALEGKELEAAFVGNHVSLREVQRKLALEHVASVIAPEPAGALEPGMHPRLFLMVRADELEDVRRVVQQQWQQGLQMEGVMLQEREQAPEVGTCPACGTEVSETVAECPECGLFIGESGEGE